MKNVMTPCCNCRNKVKSFLGTLILLQALDRRENMAYVHQKGFFPSYKCFSGSLSFCNFGGHVEMLLNIDYVSKYSVTCHPQVY